jgi:hypothetical protein
LGKLGKGFFIKSDGRVMDWKRQRLEKNRTVLLGMKPLKMCVVDAFVYESAISIEFMGVLPGFYKFNVNLLEVSL